MNKQHSNYIPMHTYRLVLLLSILIASFSYAQEDDLGTEVVNIVKPYTPTISDAFKVKETPILKDSTNTQKKAVQYEIFSVPVASTFTPAKGKATTVEKAAPIPMFDNYATLGFGTYTSVLAELFSSFEISRTDNASLFFRHNSSQGDIDEVVLENKFYDTELRGAYNSRQRDMTYGIEAGIQHQLFNWYGLNSQFDGASETILAIIDPQQTYFGVDIGGSVGFEESLFTKANGQIYYTGDAFSSSEFQTILKPEFLLPLNNFNLKVDLVVDYLTGSFERDYSNSTDINYSYLNAGIAPSLVYIDENLTMSLGAQAMLSLDSENSETDIYIYPKINASYRLVDELLIAYGGAEGGLAQNTYREFIATNPFVSPTLGIAPTSTLYNAFGGLKGKLSNEIGYNIRASYGKQENRSFYQLNRYKGKDIDFEGYEFGNSFGVIYDDLNVLDVFGELQLEVTEKFSLGAQLNFYSYAMDNQEEAWNLPNLEASVFANFHITENIYGGVSLFYVGERKDLLITALSEVVTLDAFLDANVHLGYQLNDRLSVFAKGSNLLGNNYERWQNFPVQGIQGLLGATYKFNW